MEVMEDGNLMDKVHILIQRDMEYYTSKQSVLQESLCAGVVGGKLDFPRSASFAAVKLVLWWEDEFSAAFKKPSGILRMANAAKNGGIAKTSDPDKFAHAVDKSSAEFLHHLHILTQEALDHADLQVLTGTIGAAALIANCLWCFCQRADDDKNNSLLLRAQKRFQEMGEALAERLLDLHTRLISLYIQQDADCLHWESERSFCELERGSYVVQMWWLYMQGTMRDLWTSVPPKMAQRVLAGMLNESLSVFTVRYAHASPSEARAQLYAADVSNLLLCVAELLPAVCKTGKEWLGIRLPASQRLLRDIHAKCLELLACLVLRCSAMEMLHKVLSRGVDNLAILGACRVDQANPWIAFAGRYLHPNDDVCTNNVLAELYVLLAQPQADWAQLVKVVCMEKCLVAKIILRVSRDDADGHILPQSSAQLDCGAFLCARDGFCRQGCHRFGDIIQALTFLILSLGNEQDFRQYLFDFITNECGSDWVCAFDKRHVWSMQRPAWYEALVDLVRPLIPSVVDIVVNAVQTGASMFQAVAIVLASCTHLWDMIGSQLYAICAMLEDVLPSNIVPLGNSALLQVVVGALYAELVHQKHVTFDDNDYDAKVDVALAVAENLCSIDADNKHTEEIQALIDRAKSKYQSGNDLAHAGLSRITVENEEDIAVMASVLLQTREGTRSLKILHHFIANNDEWLRDKMLHKSTSSARPTLLHKKQDSLLHTMFFIGNKPFDELLVRKWRPNWQHLFAQAMGLSVERVQKHIASRWELKSGEHHAIARDIQRLLRPSAAR